MLELVLIGGALVAITVATHAFGTTYWVEHLIVNYFDQDRHWLGRHPLWALMTTVWIAVALHAIQVSIWAIAYLVVVPGEQLKSFEEALYFSFVTFTTLGYGDITLSEVHGV